MAEHHDPSGDGGDASPMRGGGRRSRQMGFGTVPRPRTVAATSQEVALAHRDAIAIRLDLPTPSQRALLDAILRAQDEAHALHRTRDAVDVYETARYRPLRPLGRPSPAGAPAEEAPGRHATTPMVDRYVGEHRPGNSIWKDGTPVRYLDPVEREGHRLIVQGGRLHWPDGRPVDTTGGRTAFKGSSGRAIVVMDANGAIYASTFHKAGHFHHSSLAAGGPVAAAGELEVRDGVLTLLTDRSGHYRPHPELMRQLVVELERQGAALDGVQVATGDDERREPARAFVERVGDASSPEATPGRENAAADAPAIAEPAPTRGWVAGTAPRDGATGSRDRGPLGGTRRLPVRGPAAAPPPAEDAVAQDASRSGQAEARVDHAPMAARPEAGRGRPTGWTRVLTAFGREPATSRVPVEACAVCGSLSCGTARAEKGWLSKILRNKEQRAADRLHRRKVKFEQSTSFDDASLVPGSKKKLGGGSNVNAVYKMLYDDRTGKTHVVFYKPPPAGEPEGAGAFRKTGNRDYRLAARAVMSYQLAQALGLDLLSREVFATHVNDEGELETGNASFEVPGEPLQKDVGVDAERSAELAAKYGDEARVTVIELRTDLPMATPEAQRSLTDLQALDWLTAQTDRHPGNIFMEPSGRAWGIDNDLAFGPETQAAGKNNGIPPVVHEDTAQKILAMSEEDLEAILDGAVPESERLTRGESPNKLYKTELEAAKERLRAFQAQLRDGRTQRVTGFDDATFDTLRESPNNYIGTYVGLLRQTESSPEIDEGGVVEENGRMVRTGAFNTLQGGALPAWAMKADDPRRQPRDDGEAGQAEQGGTPDASAEQSAEQARDEGSTDDDAATDENADALPALDDADRELVSGESDDASPRSDDARSNVEAAGGQPAVGGKALPKELEPDGPREESRTQQTTEKDACSICGSTSCNAARTQKGWRSAMGSLLKKAKQASPKQLLWRAKGGRGRRPLGDGDLSEKSYRSKGNYLVPIDVRYGSKKGVFRAGVFNANAAEIARLAAFKEQFGVSVQDTDGELEDDLGLVERGIRLRGTGAEVEHDSSKESSRKNREYKTPARRVGVSNLSAFLGVDAVPEERFARHRVEAGSFDEVMDGSVELGRKGEVLVDARQRKTEKGGERPPATWNNTLDLSRPETQQSLANLQVLDYLAGRIRPASDIVVDPTTGLAQGVHNDDAFPMQAPSVQLPPFVDAHLAEKILALDADTVARVVSSGVPQGSQLPQGSIEAMQERLDTLKAHVASLEEQGKLVSSWNADTYAQAREHLVAKLGKQKAEFDALTYASKYDAPYFARDALAMEFTALGLVVPRLGSIDRVRDPSRADDVYRAMNGSVLALAEKQAAALEAAAITRGSGLSFLDGWKKRRAPEPGRGDNPGGAAEGGDAGWRTGGIAQGREDASTGRAPRIGLPRMSASHAGHSPRAAGSQSKSNHHSHASHSGTNTNSRKNAKSTHRGSKHHGSKGSSR